MKRCAYALADLGGNAASHLTQMHQALRAAESALAYDKARLPAGEGPRFQLILALMSVGRAHAHLYAASAEKELRKEDRDSYVRVLKHVLDVAEEATRRRR